jgi:hypothetical protein
LWQLAQGPVAWAWSMNCISRHVEVRWQLSHRFVVIGCDCGSPGAVIVLWHPTHCVGVLLKRPLTWHEAQGTPACVPVSGNPVKKWLYDVVNADCAWLGATTSTTAAAMADNIRPSDLNEIIAIYPPRPLQAAGLFKAPRPGREPEIDSWSSSSGFPLRQQSTITGNTAILAAWIRPIRYANVFQTRRLSRLLAYLLERARRVAAAAGLPEWATMGVVLAVAGIAIRSQRDFDDVPGNVAGLAIEIAVRSR